MSIACRDKLDPEAITKLFLGNKSFSIKTVISISVDAAPAAAVVIAFVVVVVVVAVPGDGRGTLVVEQRLLFSTFSSAPVSVSNSLPQTSII